MRACVRACVCVRAYVCKCVGMLFVSYVCSTSTVDRYIMLSLDNKVCAILECVCVSMCTYNHVGSCDWP